MRVQNTSGNSVTGIETRVEKALIQDSLEYITPMTTTYPLICSAF